MAADKCEMITNSKVLRNVLRLNFIQSILFTWHQCFIQLCYGSWNQCLELFVLIIAYAAMLMDRTTIIKIYGLTRIVELYKHLQTIETTKYLFILRLFSRFSWFVSFLTTSNCFIQNLHMHINTEMRNAKTNRVQKME